MLLASQGEPYFFYSFRLRNFSLIVAMIASSFRFGNLYFSLIS